jgi:hypothetical protein
MMRYKHFDLRTHLSVDECVARFNASPALRGSATPGRFSAQRQRAFRNGLARFAVGRFVPVDDGTRVELKIGPPPGAIPIYAIVLLLPVLFALVTGAWWYVLLIPLGGVFLGVVGLVLWSISEGDTEFLHDTLIQILEARPMPGPP